MVTLFEYCSQDCMVYSSLWSINNEFIDQICQDSNFSININAGCSPPDCFCYLNLKDFDMFNLNLKMFNRNKRSEQFIQYYSSISQGMIWSVNCNKTCILHLSKTKILILKQKHFSTCNFPTIIKFIIARRTNRAWVFT